MDIINEFLNAIINVFVFSIIPVIWWTLTSKSKISFFDWIGFKTPSIKDKKRFLLMFCGYLVISVAILFFIDLFIPKTEQIASVRFAGKGIQAIIPGLIFSFLKTGLAEEIFFRGFLGKRFIKLFGFRIGNIMQASIFGFLHGAMLYSFYGLWKSVFVIVLTGMVGWFAGFINEKEANGSIVPSLCLHGIANTFSVIAVMFK